MKLRKLENLLHEREQEYRKRGITNIIHGEAHAVKQGLCRKTVENSIIKLTAEAGHILNSKIYHKLSWNGKGNTK